MLTLTIRDDEAIRIGDDIVMQFHGSPSKRRVSIWAVKDGVKIPIQRIPIEQSYDLIIELEKPDILDT